MLSSENRPHCSVLVAAASAAVTGRYSSRNLRPQRCRRDLAARDVGPLLDDTAELDLEPARQVEVVLALEDVSHAPLAGLAVDAYDGLVGPADVVGVDGQVRHTPHQVIDGRCRRIRSQVGLHELKALLDRILV